MESPIEKLSFFDQETNDCPFPAYAQLRDEAPVWRDPVTGMFVLTRYEDVRMVLLDTKRFSNEVGTRDGDVERQITGMFQSRGWAPTASLDGLDEPRHMELRRVLEHAFRPAQVKELEPFIEALAYRLVDSFLDDGSCEFVSAFAVPLPLHTIGHRMGMEEEALPQIKRWADAFIARLGLMLNREERIQAAGVEIEAQHFFQARFEALRAQPDGTLLSDLVNNEVPAWGRPLSDAELHAEMMADLFVGGSETTTNALSAGVMLLINHPDVWRELKRDPEGHLENFVEEVVRLETPIHSLVRTTTEDVELHGVTIPAGSIVKIINAAGNRDERRFECADGVELARHKPRTHLGFGTGSHHCLGAPLARRELYFGFKALLERIDELDFVPGANDFSYHPHYFLRALRELHIRFTPTAAPPA
jgi:cytochrome P450